MQRLGESLFCIAPMLISLGKGLWGALSKVVNVTAIVQWLQQAGIFIYNLNWNITDQ